MTDSPSPYILAERRLYWQFSREGLPAELFMVATRRASPPAKRFPGTTTYSMAEKTIFKRIIDREIPAKIVYEDEHCLAFEDIHPAAPMHLVVIPKREIASVDDVTEADAQVVGHLFVAIRPSPPNWAWRTAIG